MAQENEPMKFEDLSSAYRIEMGSPSLGELRKDLYHALAALQENSQREYEAEYSKDPDSIMCEGMNERRKKVNILVQKVIDLRMEKVAMMALRAAMGANNILDKLTAEERDYYNRVTEDSKKHRNAILRDRSRKNYVIPEIAPAVPEKKSRTPPAAVPAEVPATAAAAVPEMTEHEGEILIEHPHADIVEAPRDDLVTIRILEDLPKIAGPDCDYELKKENVVRMPAALANALINHEKAVRLNVTP